MRDILKRSATKTITEATQEWGSEAQSNAAGSGGFTRGGNGVENTDFEENHYFLVFDIASSREARKSLILFPEPTVAGITFKLHFLEALTNPAEHFLVDEQNRQVFIDATRDISKNSLINGQLHSSQRSPKLLSYIESKTCWGVVSRELRFVALFSTAQQQIDNPKNKTRN